MCQYWVWGFCERLLTFHCFEGGMVWRIYVQSLAVEVCDPWDGFWTLCHYLIVYIWGTYELEGTVRWKWTLWYLLTYQVWEILLTIVWGDLLWWGCVCDMFVNQSLYKSSASCLGAFPFDNLFEICSQNGSIWCICRSAPNLSAVRDFSAVLCVSVTSGPTASVCGVICSCELCWAILLIVC